MTQYIDKDTVIEEINRQYNHLREHPSICGSGYILGFRQACWQIIDFCNSLEVKEVDLEKEIDNQICLLCGVHTMEDDTNWYKGPYSELIVFAKHFFELGLKIQKGE